MNCFVNFKKLRNAARIPCYASAMAAGADVYACIEVPVSIMPGEVKKIPTGFATEFSEDMVALILPRSGTATNRGLVLANTMPVIDADYRGEWIIPVFNRSNQVQTILPDERFAQILFMPVLHPRLQEVEKLSDTARGEGGFGSTGIK